MFCTNCGTQCGDDQAFCPSCGKPLNSTANANSQTSANNQFNAGNVNQNQFNQNQFNQAGAGQNQNNSAPNFANQAQSFMGQVGSAYNNMGLPMNWYKALIYAILFISALVNFVNGIRYLIGSDVSKYIGGGYRVVEILYGIVVIALAGFAIYVRQLLAGLKKDGPKMFLLLYIVSAGIGIVFSILFAITASAIPYFGSTIMDATIGLNIVTIVIDAALVVANYQYFQNRKHLFVN